MTHANRGKYLEEWIEHTNQVYNNKGLAIINKIPTPWKIQRKFSPFTKQYSISGAFPEKKSTVDFGGTASKQSIWFDVKTTTNRTSFPLSNVYGHQLEYLQKVDEQGGKAFILIHFKVYERTFLIWIDQLMKFRAESGRKSIPITWLEDYCEEVKKGQGVMLDYLPIVLRRDNEK
jgi:recombination protein U